MFPSFNPSLNPLLVYTAGRFTDGPDTLPATSLTGVWVEQLAAKLGVAIPTPSLAGGTNYAFGGATSGTGNTVLNGGPLQALNVADQISLYLSTKSIDSNALYIVWAGANDILKVLQCVADELPGDYGRYDRGNQYPVRSVRSASGGCQTRAMGQRYAAGYQKRLDPLNPENAAVQQASSAYHTLCATLAAIQSLDPGALTGLTFTRWAM